MIGLNIRDRSSSDLSPRKCRFPASNFLPDSDLRSAGKLIIRITDSLFHKCQYLALYTHRVAISNHRLVSFDGESVTFRRKRLHPQKQKAENDDSADEYCGAFCYRRCREASSASVRITSWTELGRHAAPGEPTTVGNDIGLGSTARDSSAPLSRRRFAAPRWSSSSGCHQR
jgi:hypothetical protein